MTKANLAHSIQIPESDILKLFSRTGTTIVLYKHQLRGQEVFTVLNIRSRDIKWPNLGSTVTGTDYTAILEEYTSRRKLLEGEC